MSIKDDIEYEEIKERRDAALRADMATEDMATQVGLVVDKLERIGIVLERIAEALDV